MKQNLAKMEQAETEAHQRVADGLQLSQRLFEEWQDSLGFELRREVSEERERLEGAWEHDSYEAICAENKSPRGLLRALKGAQNQKRMKTIKIEK